MGVSITPKEFSEKIRGGAVAVDVRSRMEHVSGAIPGSINIPFLDPKFLENFEKLNREAEYVLYCETGNRSGAAQNILESIGYKKTFNLLGGFSAWKKI